MPDFSIEKSFSIPVVGIDEVGRGPLAGPVVSCASIFLDYKIDKLTLLSINDSKKLTLNKRNFAYELIKELKNQKKFNYSLGVASVKEIEKFNILEATKISMKRALKNLNYKKGTLIIDGNINLDLDNFENHTITKGDQKSYTIAAASIIAKTHRDRYMFLLSKKYPSYKWDKNSGYGTKKHIEQIRLIGITKHHRRTFEPIKSLIQK